MRTSTLRSLKQLTDKRVRHALVDSHLRNGIAFQIRALRRDPERKWTQGDLAREAGMKPTQITRIENPSYGSHTVATLRRIASAFDVALIVRFVPFTELLKWDRGPRLLAPPSFWSELQLAKTEASIPTPDNVIEIAARSQHISTQPPVYAASLGPQMELQLASISDKTVQADVGRNTYGSAATSGNRIRTSDSDRIR